MLTIIVLIGITVCLVGLAIIYCMAMENEEPDYRKKYIEQLKINKELLDQVIRTNEEL